MGSAAEEMVVEVDEVAENNGFSMHRIASHILFVDEMKLDSGSCCGQSGNSPENHSRLGVLVLLCPVPFHPLA